MDPAVTTRRDEEAGPAPGRTGPAAAAAPRSYSSRVLFQGAREVRILHRGQEYRLRVTRAGKLILTK